MAKIKQHVFSARTTEAGLELLNELKDRLHLAWDEMVIDGMCGHYKLDKAMLTLPKKEKAPGKEPEIKPEANKNKNRKKATSKKASGKGTPTKGPTGNAATEPPPSTQ